MINSIGQRIENYFDQSQYTYDDISVATNITYKDLLKVFKDEKELNMEELKAFAMLFNTTVEKLCFKNNQ